MHTSRVTGRTFSGEVRSDLPGAATTAKRNVSRFSPIQVALVITAFILSIPLARADIRYKNLGGEDVIAITGEIVEGDATRFDTIVAALPGHATVVLNSFGGKLVEGLTIGETLRRAGYATMVLNGSTCASTCALIWLAGTQRYIGTSAMIGFHAAYTGRGEAARESGTGNALVGAYLTKLRLPYQAVVFATSAGPDELAWLHPAEASKAGITCVTLPDDPAPARSAGPVQVQRPTDPREQRARALVLAYYDAWSCAEPGVAGLTAFFDDTVTFYGARLPQAKVMTEKQKFSERWPTRRYSVRTETLFVQCTEICAASGVVDWDVSSAARGVRSTGSANFVLRIAPANVPNGGVIVSENGAVLSGHTEPLAASQTAPEPNPAMFASTTGALERPAEQQAASVTTAYADGRRARIAYEQWFDALLEGEYKDGAQYWAANRSQKPAPACIAATESPDWQAGCSASRTFLTTADQRRRTEKDYWSGWNSL